VTALRVNPSGSPSDRRDLGDLRTEGLSRRGERGRRRSAPDLDGRRRRTMTRISAKATTSTTAICRSAAAPGKAGRRHHPAREAIQPDGERLAADSLQMQRMQPAAALQFMVGCLPDAMRTAAPSTVRLDAARRRLPDGRAVARPRSRTSPGRGIWRRRRKLDGFRPRRFVSPANCCWRRAMPRRPRPFTARRSQWHQ
jgi:hypothetical protein